MLVATATRGSLRRRPHSSRKRQVRRRFCRSSAGVIPSCTTEGSFDSSNALGTLACGTGGAPPGGGGGLAGGAPDGGRGRPPGGAPGGEGRAGCGWDIMVRGRWYTEDRPSVRSADTHVLCWLGRHKKMSKIRMRNGHVA